MAHGASSKAKIGKRVGGLGEQPVQLAVPRGEQMIKSEWREDVYTAKGFEARIRLFSAAAREGP
jgi:hypothetical protein